MATMRIFAVRVLLAVVVVLALAPASRAGIEDRFRAAINGGDLRQAKVGVLVEDLTTGRTLASINPDEPMIPASNMKLVTSAAAIKVLGPHFAFRTELRRIEPKDWAVLANENSATPTTPGAAAEPVASLPTGTCLVIKGDGDPGLGDPELLRAHNMDVEQFLSLWVDAVEQTGLKTIDQLIADDRVFDRVGVHPTWPSEQLASWYCAEVSGINFYDNCIDVLAEPTKPGQPPRVRVMPATPHIDISNTAQTNGGKDFFINRKPNSNAIYVTGGFKARRTQAYNITVHDPAIYFATTLADRLLERGIKVKRITRPGQDDRIPNGQTLLAIENEIGLLAARCNKDSQNLFAESFIKRVGRAVTGQPGSWDNGAASIRLFLRDTLGPQAASVIIADGSGLSRDNRVSPRAFVELLKAMNKDASVASVYRNSLSISGADGTLEKRFGTKIKGRVYGKSGYIGGVSTLSGYLAIADPNAPNGERLIAFSFLFNFNKTAGPANYKAVQDKFISILDQDLTPVAPKVTPAAQPVGLGG